MYGTYPCTYGTAVLRPAYYELLEREKPPSPSYPLDMYLPLALSKYKPEFDSESESESRSIRWVSTDCDATV